MRYKKFFLLLVLIVLMCMTSCGDKDKISFSEKRAIDKINKSLEMSLNLKSASIETNILEDSYHPEGDLVKVETEFNVEKPIKDKNARNIEFNVLFTYEDRQDHVKSYTNYEGIYLNIYYPYPKYNKIESDTVKSVEVSDIDSGKQYIVYYKKTHLSRRVEWEYCKVEEDYETFVIDDEGVIIEYKSNTCYKQKDKNTSTWIDGKSQLDVKLKEYSLLD